MTVLSLRSLATLNALLASSLALYVTYTFEAPVTGIVAPLESLIVLRSLNSTPSVLVPSALLVRVVAYEPDATV